MSVEAVAKVLRYSKCGGNHLLLLILIANGCNEFGTNGSFTIPILSEKSRRSERTTQRAIAELVNSGELIVFHNEGHRIHSNKSSHTRTSSLFNIVFQDGSNEAVIRFDTLARIKGSHIQYNETVKLSGIQISKELFDKMGCQSVTPKQDGVSICHPKIEAVSENDEGPTIPKSNEINDLEWHENCNNIKGIIKEKIKSNSKDNKEYIKTTITNSKNSLDTQNGQGQRSETEFQELSVDEQLELFFADGFTSESESFTNDSANGSALLTNEAETAKIESQIKGQPNLFNKKLPSERSPGVKIKKDIQSVMVELCYGITDPKQWNVLTGKQFGQIKFAVQAMQKAGSDFSKMDVFKEWWKSNFRSRNLNGSYKCPSPNQVRELWFEAMSASQPVIQTGTKPLGPKIDTNQLETITRSLASKNRGKSK